MIETNKAITEARQIVREARQMKVKALVMRGAAARAETESVAKNLL